MTFKRRVLGVVWRVGANRSSHWLCASYEHSEVPFNQRSWFKKESIGPSIDQVTSEDVTVILKQAMTEEQDCFIVIDCKWILYKKNVDSFSLIFVSVGTRIYDHGL